MFSCSTMISLNFLNRSIYKKLSKNTLKNWRTATGKMRWLKRFSCKMRSKRSIMTCYTMIKIHPTLSFKSMIILTLLLCCPMTSPSRKKAKRIKKTSNHRKKTWLLKCLRSRWQIILVRKEEALFTSRRDVLVFNLLQRGLRRS